MNPPNPPSPLNPPNLPSPLSPSHPTNPHFKDSPKNINHYNLNKNEVDEINNVTNSRENNQNENQVYFYWNDAVGTQLANELNSNYEKIVHWKRNLSMLPSGTAGKNYIEEVIRLMKLWVNDTPLKKIAWKAVHVMPALLLQKPSKSSKSKDHHADLERRLKLWEEGKIEELLYEGQTTQERMKSPDSSMTIAKISMKFRVLMSKGNVNGA